MKKIKPLIAGLIVSTLLVGSLVTKAEDTKVKPYLLKTCIVSGEKFGGGMAPITLTNDNQVIKLCCKGCLKDFKKDPEKFMKKLKEEEAKLAAQK